MLDKEREGFLPHYLTIDEIREMYREKDTPLNADTILATLEPLAGTSFLKHATDILRSLTSNREAPYKPIQALDLYLIFYGAFDETVKSTSDLQQEDAVTCLYHLSGFSVPLDAVYTMKWMEPDELVAREFRSDFLYYDVEKAQPAGEHIAAQFRFYKAGIHRHTISVSTLAYSDENQRYHLFTQLSEGNMPHRFFGDWKSPPLPFLDPRLSLFDKTRPLLFISPHFVERQITRQKEQQ